MTGIRMFITTFTSRSCRKKTIQTFHSVRKPQNLHQLLHSTMEKGQAKEKEKGQAKEKEKSQAKEKGQAKEKEKEKVLMYTKR
jgi:hypothetical protein